MQPAILLCFFYFIFQTTAVVGLQTFLPAALNTGLDIPLIVATSAVTAYLLGGTAGIVVGGFLAVRTARHDRVAATGLLTGAMLLMLVAGNLVPMPVLVPLFVVIGLSVGATGPSRDLIVRNATPKGAAGRVYGFVYSGLDIGVDAGAGLVRLAARSRAAACDALRDQHALRRGDRNRRPGAAGDPAARGLTRIERKPLRAFAVDPDDSKEYPVNFAARS